MGRSGSLKVIPRDSGFGASFFSRWMHSIAKCEPSCSHQQYLVARELVLYSFWMAVFSGTQFHPDSLHFLLMSFSCSFRLFLAGQLLTARLAVCMSFDR